MASEPITREYDRQPFTVTCPADGLYQVGVANGLVTLVLTKKQARALALALIQETS